MDRYLMSKITPWSDTSIKDQKIVDFINNIRAEKLRGIVREYFEHECYFRSYTLEDFRKEFIRYLKGENNDYRFLPGLGNHYEDILKMLLKIKKEELE